ncbi:MAG: septal ring lytic transglycosylase RlpA family protein [Chitinispirillaceae bacterium]|nr:septal ring lytic transglycosylase RlpA family protein [Chitinispirillaceae bacterium]
MIISIAEATRECIPLRYNAGWGHIFLVMVGITGCYITSCAQAPRYTRSVSQVDSGTTLQRSSAPVSTVASHTTTMSGTFYQTGKATYYGNKFHGRKTASGERYDRNEFTAAHRTLPFGTRVKVTRLSNGKTVSVRINDRGPLKRGRVIDLSRAAAEEIGMIVEGVVDVGIEIIEE